jgi:hypothetical protein
VASKAVRMASFHGSDRTKTGRPPLAILFLFSTPPTSTPLVFSLPFQCDPGVPTVPANEALLLAAAVFIASICGGVISNLTNFVSPV